MNVRTMRRVDRWLGAPMCGILTLERRLGRLFGAGGADDPPRRIAVVKLAEQGATVLAYPALLQASEMVGRPNVFFVVFAENRFILDLLDVIPAENVISIRTDGLWRLAGDTVRALLRMRREKIDTAVDFEFFARSSAIVTYLSGARKRVGFHAFHGEASYRGDLMTHRLSFNPFLHASEMFQLLIRAVKIPSAVLPACEMEPPVTGVLPEYRVADQDLRDVRAILCEALAVDRVPPLILLNANCSDLLPLRRWPPERYAELTRRLLERFPEAAVVYTGAPKEAPDANELVVKVGSPRCVSLAGRTTMPQLIALYELSELMVTNDSGPAQYATLTGIDIVVLFGPETPAVFGARTPRTHILWAGIPCSPCVNAFNDRQSACRDNICMQKISIDDVLELADRVYRDREVRRAQG